MKKPSTFLIVIGILSLFVSPKSSYADGGWGQHAGHHGGHHYYRYRDHPHVGIHVSAFYPGEYYSIWAGGRSYYYDDGVYYSYLGGNYVVVAPPMGAVVSTIPSDFQPTIINGVTYYMNNGSYYMQTTNGYMVVSPPSVPAQPVAANTPNVVTVNVPTNAGGYATITLRRSGNGYVGPQGEFYAQFPSTSQLRTMYGK